MSEYTPTTDAVRDRWGKRPHFRAEFDRWLAAEKAEWQAEVAERIAQRCLDSAHRITELVDFDRYFDRLAGQDEGGDRG